MYFFPEGEDTEEDSRVIFEYFSVFGAIQKFYYVSNCYLVGFENTQSLDKVLSIQDHIVGGKVRNFTLSELSQEMEAFLDNKYSQTGLQNEISEREVLENTRSIEEKSEGLFSDPLKRIKELQKIVGTYDFKNNLGKFRPLIVCLGRQTQPCICNFMIDERVDCLLKRCDVFLLSQMFQRRMEKVKDNSRHYTGHRILKGKPGTQKKVLEMCQNVSLENITEKPHGIPKLDN